MNCNCFPMPDYMAEYIESMNQWTKWNQEYIELYLAWCNVWLSYTRVR